MAWIDYMLMAAQHSKDSAEHWFRYLRKYIDKCGTAFTEADVDALCNNVKLTPFQRISLKSAFTEGSPTRQHIIKLNEPGRRDVLSRIKAELKEARL